MLKLMHKKLNKKGFTLAELLVVIAILAILIAIAVPVFTHMVAEANLRVNQANVHSVRSAAVAHILTHLGDNDDTYNSTTKLNQYMGKDDHYWVATAAVDNNGNISELRVYALDSTIDRTYDLTLANAREGISINPPEHVTGSEHWRYMFFPGHKTGFAEISDDVKSEFASLKPSMGKVKPNADANDTTKVYWVQAIVTDLKTDTTTS